MYRLYSPYYAAKELGISCQTLTRRAKAGKIRFIIIGKNGERRYELHHQKFTKEQLNEMLNMRDTMLTLGVTNWTILRLVRDGYLKQYPGPIKFHNRYSRREIMEFIEKGGRKV